MSDETLVITECGELQAFMLEADKIKTRLLNMGPWHVEFDLPNNGMAKMHVIGRDTTLVIINCFSWTECQPFVRLTKYGDNHRWRAVSWNLMGEYLWFYSRSTPLYRELMLRDELESKFDSMNAPRF